MQVREWGKREGVREWGNRGSKRVGREREWRERWSKKIGREGSERGGVRDGERKGVIALREREEIRVWGERGSKKVGREGKREVVRKWGE